MLDNIVCTSVHVVIVGGGVSIKSYRNPTPLKRTRLVNDTVGSRSISFGSMPTLHHAVDAECDLHPGIISRSVCST